jgi:predicted ArsR family transcriptional regulator
LTKAALSVEDANEIAGLASLLSHPLRARLLTALATTGPGSATLFSGRFGDATVGDCHYHLKVLRKDGVVELDHSRPVRGVTERVYRLARPSRLPGALPLRHFADLLLAAAAGNSPKLG